MCLRPKKNLTFNHMKRWFRLVIWLWYGLVYHAFLHMDKTVSVICKWCSERKRLHAIKKVCHYGTLAQLMQHCWLMTVLQNTRLQSIVLSYFPDFPLHTRIFHKIKPMLRGQRFQLNEEIHEKWPLSAFKEETTQTMVYWEQILSASKKLFNCAVSKILTSKICIVHWRRQLTIGYKKKFSIQFSTFFNRLYNCLSLVHYMRLSRCSS